MSKLKFGPPPARRFDVTPSAEQVKFFRDNGFLAVERITTDEEIEWMRRIYEHIFSPEHDARQSSPIDRSANRDPNAASLLSQSFYPEIEFPELLTTNHWRNSKRMAAALLGVEESRLGSWGHMIKKPPGGKPALWHQDHAYWAPEMDYCALGVWLPMHDVAVEMGAMQFIPGSHKRGLLKHRHADEPQYNVLTVDAPFDAASAVACPLKKGGCTFHHSETLHYTAPNTTDRPRLAYPMEFQVTPVRREQPLDMPWMEQFRRATGESSRRIMHVADGVISRL